MRRALALVGVIACASPSSGPPKLAEGASCGHASACASNVCVDADLPTGGRCAKPCSADTDCESARGCGKAADGTAVCVPRCTEPYGAAIADGQPQVENACWNGLSIPCEQLPADTTCGCACVGGTFCDVAADKATATCRPQAAVGGACVADYGCASANCDLVTKKCAVAVGAPCTQSNCQVCTAQGWCTRSCDDVRCPVGTTCIGFSPDTHCAVNCGALASGCPAGTTCLSAPPDTPGRVPSVCE
jgi:hypothetical protein